MFKIIAFFIITLFGRLPVYVRVGILLMWKVLACTHHCLAYSSIDNSTLSRTMTLNVTSSNK